MKALHRVVVSGVGTITSLANDIKSCWTRLLNGASGIVHTRSLKDPGYDNLTCKVAAPIPDELIAEYVKRLGKEREWNALPKFIKIALIAAEEAIDGAGCTREDLYDAAVVIGSGMAPLDLVGLAHVALTSNGQRRVGPHFIPRILPNMPAGHVSIQWGTTGPLLSPASACATGLHAIGDAFRLIRHGYSSIALAGATEAAVNPLAIAGFAQARALSTSFSDVPEKSSRPFDKDRDGFVLGEGAAVLVLESLEHALDRNAPILAEICGYGCSADAHHITASHPQGLGAIKAMKLALADAQQTINDIDYINAHATSTPIGDRVELMAIAGLAEKRPDDNPLIVGSNKGAIGHLLGAAGAVEVAFSVMAIKEEMIPPTLNFSHFDEEIADLKVVYASSQPLSRPVNAILKNSFGFGGTNASLVMRKFSLDAYQEPN